MGGSAGKTWALGFLAAALCSRGQGARRDASSREVRGRGDRDGLGPAMLRQVTGDLASGFIWRNTLAGRGVHARNGDGSCPGQTRLGRLLFGVAGPRVGLGRRSKSRSQGGSAFSFLFVSSMRPSEPGLTCCVQPECWWVRLRLRLSFS